MDLKDEGRRKETRGGEERRGEEREERGGKRREKRKGRFLYAEGCFMPLLQSGCLETLWSISERAEDKH